MQVYIITGASRGLGAALVRELAAEETHIICISRTRNIEVVSYAESKGAAVSWHELDLSNTENLLKRAPEIFPPPFKIGKVEEITLFNNAATVEPVGPAGIFDVKRGAASIALGFTAVTVLTSYFISTYRGLPAVKRIINITSGAADRAIEGVGIYSAVKSAVNAFTRTVAGEQASENDHVVVGAVSPGMVETDMQERLRRTGEDRLPTKEFYVQAHERGDVVPPAEGAKKVLEFVFSNFENGTITHS